MAILQLRFLSWLLLLLCWALPFSSVNGQQHLQVAAGYFGPQDNPDNYGPNIKKFLKGVGLPQGNPYCAAFVSYCLDMAGAASPTVRSALASDFILPQSIDAKHVMMGRVVVPAGSIAIWRRGNTIFGHAGFVLMDWQGSEGITIEGNASLYGIEGVWILRQTISPANYFRITHFTPVTYAN